MRKGEGGEGGGGGEAGREKETNSESHSGFARLYSFPASPDGPA